jgi:hypothetical protein
MSHDTSSNFAFEVTALNSATEGNSGTTTITFRLRANNNQATLYYRTVDGTASTADGDYVPQSGEFFMLQTNGFGAVVRERFVTITVNGDTRAEGNEHFFLLVYDDPEWPLFGQAINAPGVIINEDEPGSVAIGDVTVVEGTAGAKLATFRHPVA